jgi:hypothetical protein
VLSNVPTGQIRVPTHQRRHRAGGGRSVDRVANRSAFDRVEQNPRRFDCHLDLRFFRAGSQMRRYHAIVQPGESDVLRRLLGEYVQRGARDPLGRQSVVQSILVDDPASRAIDQANGRLHHRDLLGVDHVERLFVSRHVDRDVIRFLEDSLDIVGNLDADLLGILGCGKRIVPQNLHIESASHPDDRHADTSQADDAENLVVELIAHVLAVPGSRLEAVARRHDVAAQR